MMVVANQRGGPFDFIVSQSLDLEMLHPIFET